MWNWATSFLPGPQIDWLMFSLSLIHSPLKYPDAFVLLLLLYRQIMFLCLSRLFSGDCVEDFFIGFQVCLSNDDHKWSNAKTS